MQIKIPPKSSQEKNPNFLENVIIPDQTHSNNIVEIITWKEDLTDCDGIFTSRKNNFKLAIKTADCSAIVFYDEKNYWIIHAGWRWWVNWIIEKMLKKFDNPEIFVAPFLKSFEIQKDFCYDLIYKKFWDKYFEEKSRDVALLHLYNEKEKLPHLYNEDNKIIFNFEKALKSLLWTKANFDKRNTLEDEDFYSWRRDKTNWRNYTIIEK